MRGQRSFGRFNVVHPGRCGRRHGSQHAIAIRMAWASHSSISAGRWRETPRTSSALLSPVQNAATGSALRSGLRLKNMAVFFIELWGGAAPLSALPSGGARGKDIEVAYTPAMGTVMRQTAWRGNRDFFYG